MQPTANPNRAFLVQPTANPNRAYPVQPTANPNRAYPVQPTANPNWAFQVQSKSIMTGVTGICVSQGCVFPAHISLGMRISPHTYH